MARRPRGIVVLGIYVHVPFCSAICNYCNFNRGLFDAALKTRYVEVLETEIRSAGLKACATEIAGQKAGATPTVVAQAFRPAADSIYFGGGTPSLLDPDEIARIIAACRDTFEVADDAEVTMEANPESVSLERLAAYRAAGVNRLSFGVQSFRNNELRRLSRLHGADRARAAFREARAAGFDNVSVDLMMWLPEQLVADWLVSVDAAVALEPEHVSLYMLEVYPNAPLRDEMARAKWSQAPDEDVEAMYFTAMERFDAAGLHQYEISNVARPGRESRHNLKYWRDAEWIGFGCGAHSTRGGVRWKNLASTGEYIDRIMSGQDAAVDKRYMSDDERLGDALFTGLRLTEGIDIDAVQQRYGVDVWSRYGARLEEFVHAGLLVRESNRLRLTRRGMLLAHEVMAVFV